MLRTVLSIMDSSSEDELTDHLAKRRTWMREYMRKRRAAQQSKVTESSHGYSVANHSPTATSSSSSAEELISEMTESDCEQEVSDFDTVDLSDFLRSWKAEFYVGHNAMNSLLKGLSRCGISGLPQDCRTLMGFFGSVDVVKTLAGEAWFREKDDIISCMAQEAVDLGLETTIFQVQLSSDGVQLWMHSALEFYPIYLKLVSVKAKPILCALHYGRRPPLQFYEMFLSRVFGNDNGQMNLSSVVADLPARNLMKQTPGHQSFHACEFCLSVAESIEHTTVFLDPFPSDPLTHNNFVDRMYPEKHAVGSRSPFLAVSHDIVQDWPVDMMHCVFAGVVRRMLEFMNKRGRVPVRLNNDMKRAISERLVLQKSPSDLQRSSRSFFDWPNWSCTEKRMFLMYTGLFSMREIIVDSLWDAWANLSCAIHLLSRPSPSENDISFAERLLRDHHIAAASNRVLGRKFPTINSHLLLHLPECVRRHGSLDLFSAFSYENFNMILKKHLHGRRFPLQEVVKRILEEEKLQTIRTKNDVRRRERSAIISSRNPDNHWGFFEAENVIGIFKLHHVQGEELLGYSYDIKSAFLSPFDSRLVNIYELGNLARNKQRISVMKLAFKCFVLGDDDAKWVIPLAHTC